MRSHRSSREQAGSFVVGWARPRRRCRPQTTPAPPPPSQRGLALDPTLSALDVSVDTAGGRVRLAGQADSPAAIARAMRIAFEQGEVYEVISTLRVPSARESSPPREAG